MDLTDEVLSMLPPCQETKKAAAPPRKKK
jgi:hypothetical protein